MLLTLMTLFLLPESNACARTHPYINYLLADRKKNSSNVGGIEQSLFWHDETLLYIIDIVESIYIIDIFETIYIIDIVLIYIIDII